ncbi:MAG: 50S ribosomal protein L6 [Candidatus Methanodesulfokora sp.]|nr:MAG: 50S ribosomal protein L6 [Candidatus Korarchaeota archaeon]
MRYPKTALNVITRTVEIKPEVKVEIAEDVIVVRGPKGELRRKFSREFLDITVEDGKVKLVTYDDKRFNRAYIGTMASHIKNMINGVVNGFRKEMIIVFAHFPMRVEVDKNKKVVIINNFVGSRAPRIAKIVGNTDVKVEGDRIIIEGPSKEDVSQTAANIRQATKIKDKDSRVFMDGIYVLEE